MATGEGKAFEDGETSMVLDRLLDPTAAPAHAIPNIEVMTEEALTLVSAGYDSTAIAMLLGFFYICQNPEVYDKMESELDRSIPKMGKISLQEIRKLPYLVRRTSAGW